jgi:hypothetical protein
MVVADPLLTDYRIGAGSPARDAGDQAISVAVDIDGDGRGGRLDIGADEITDGTLAPPTLVDLVPIAN